MSEAKVSEAPGVPAHAEGFFFVQSYSHSACGQTMAARHFRRLVLCVSAQGDWAVKHRPTVKWLTTYQYLLTLLEITYFGKCSSFELYLCVTFNVWCVHSLIPQPYPLDAADLSWYNTLTKLQLSSRERSNSRM